MLCQLDFTRGLDVELPVLLESYHFILALLQDPDREVVARDNQAWIVLFAYVQKNHLSKSWSLTSLCVRLQVLLVQHFLEFSIRPYAEMQSIWFR